ncbi:hypothetical protein SAMN05444171_4892 [Bradyrhizobium lablabi]|uniref:Uncharacterized protein n=1 Tax=Bradyrhizobium lablabi TaxID=722472 RepID=A0A1H5CW70_9BRAD|nr:hypothetical protein SAMN05444171_4892 [Bradyrhizobium lablabi]
MRAAVRHRPIAEDGCLNVSKAESLRHCLTQVAASNISLTAALSRFIFSTSRQEISGYAA